MSFEITMDDPLQTYAQLLQLTSESAKRAWWRFWVREEKELHPARPEVRGKEYRHHQTQEGEPSRNRLFTPILLKRYLGHREEWLDRGGAYPEAVILEENTERTTRRRRSAIRKRKKRAVGYREWLGLPVRKETKRRA